MSWAYDYLKSKQRANRKDKCPKSKKVNHIS